MQQKKNNAGCDWTGKLVFDGVTPPQTRNLQYGSSAGVIHVRLPGSANDLHADDCTCRTQVRAKHHKKQGKESGYIDITRSKEKQTGYTA